MGANTCNWLNWLWYVYSPYYASLWLIVCVCVMSVWLSVDDLPEKINWLSEIVLFVKWVIVLVFLSSSASFLLTRKRINKYHVRTAFKVHWLQEVRQLGILPTGNIYCLSSLCSFKQSLLVIETGIFLFNSERGRFKWGEITRLSSVFSQSRSKNRRILNQIHLKRQLKLLSMKTPFEIMTFGPEFEKKIDFKKSKSRHRLFFRLLTTSTFINSEKRMDGPELQFLVLTGY